MRQRYDFRGIIESTGGIKLEQAEPVSKIGARWVSFYLDEAVALRNEDRDYLKDFYYTPVRAEEIDTTPIVLKTKAQTPLKNLWAGNGNDNGCRHGQTDLLEQAIRHELNGNESDKTKKKGSPC